MNSVIFIPVARAAEQSLGLSQQIANFYQWALGIGGLVALGIIVFGGILYTVSAGNASKQDDAKQWITGALIGLLLLFGSYLILNTINPELTKLNDLKLIVNEAAESGDTGSVIVIDPGSTDPVPVEPTADLRAQVNPIIFAKPNDASAVAIGCAPRA